jgi:mevalonate kinase
MSETVTITVERLKELEAAAAELPILKERFKKANHSDITRLNAYNKAHPEKVLERTKRYKDKDRDAYNARRRELRRLKKEAEAAAATTKSSGGGGQHPAVAPPDLNPGLL